jgi:predicted PP-loop superfamily ATPase
MVVCEDKTTPVQEMAGVSLALGEMLKRNRESLKHHKAILIVNLPATRAIAHRTTASVLNQELVFPTIDSEHSLVLSHRLTT